LKGLWRRNHALAPKKELQAQYAHDAAQSDDTQYCLYDVGRRRDVITGQISAVCPEDQPKAGNNQKQRSTPIVGELWIMIA